MSKFHDKKNKVKAQIKRVLLQKEDKLVLIGGLIGTYDSTGNEIVDVDGRDNFVYFRVNGSFDEVIQVFNSRVFPEFDAKVLVTRSRTGNFYEVYDRDNGQYNGSWGGNAYYFPHAFQHSFGVGDNQGSDPVFLYKRQLLQPLGVRPVATGANYAYVEGDFYVWNNDIRYFNGSNTVDFSPLISTGQYNRFVTIYLDGNSGLLGYKTGSPFVTELYTSGTISYIPDVDLTVGIPLAAYLLTSGTSSVDWDNLFDLRNFLNAGGTTPPSDIYITGSVYFTGTSLYNVLHEIYFQATGTIISKNNVTVGATKKINFNESVGLALNVAVNGQQINITATLTGSLSSGHTIADATGTYSTRTKLTFFDYSDLLSVIVSDNPATDSTDIVITGSVISTHTHAMDRFYITGGTSNILLSDFAEYVDNLFFNGSLYDPLNYTLSGNFQIWLDVIPTTTGIVVVNYVPLNY